MTEDACDAPLVAVIVVNWNGWRDTVRAHRSLQDSTYRNWLLVVVDNASQDDSLEQLSRLSDRVRVVASETNLGFAGGCNLGLAAAREARARYVFLLNCDAWAAPQTLQALVGASRRLEDAAVLGGLVRDAEGEGLQFFGSRTSAEWGRPIWFRAPEDLACLAGELVESDFIFGAALFAPLRLFDQVGEFDERYFLNFEETDWCYRARALGLRCFVVAAALVRHRGGASLGPEEGPMQTYFLRRNQLLFSERHGTVPQRARVLKGTVRYLLWRVWRNLRGRDWRLDESTRALLLAVRDYALRRFGDCPPAVRRWARAHAERRRVVSSVP